MILEYIIFHYCPVKIWTLILLIVMITLKTAKTALPKLFKILIISFNHNNTNKFVYYFNVVHKVSLYFLFFSPD